MNMVIVQVEYYWEHYKNNSSVITKGPITVETVNLQLHILNPDEPVNDFRCECDEPCFINFGKITTNSN